MPSYAQLMACMPQTFVQAGETYRRMAEGFGRVQSIFERGMRVLDCDVWSGVAKQQANQRAGQLRGGLAAGGNEANKTGQVLVTLGHALQAAQTQLRTAVATATGAGLIVTPDGNVINPNPAFNHVGNAMIGPVRAMITAAVVQATAADTAAAGQIARLAVGELVSTFGGGKAATVARSMPGIGTAPTTPRTPPFVPPAGTHPAGTPPIRG
jgi:hypothetical protein